tara:strand:- start:163429 stop:166038 length:2610 start_codon:yes stop_codon:yes gene_type:complete
MLKTTYITRLLNPKKHYLWLSTVLIILVLGGIIVCVMSLIFHGTVTNDYLITGLVTSLLAGLVMSGLITFLLKKQSDLHLDNNHLTAIIKVCPIPIAMYDLAQNIVMVNDAFTKVYGYTVEDIPTLHRWWTTAYPNKDYRQFVQKYWALRLEKMNGDGAGFEPLEMRVQCKNGSTKQVLATAAHLGECHKGLNVLVLYDNTESVTRAHNLLESIIETIPIRVFWKDTNLRFLGCNTAFAKDAGESSPENIIGKLDSELTWKNQSAMYPADDENIIKSKRSKFTYQERQTTPEGNIRWLRTSKAPILDEATGKSLGILGIYEDITQQKDIEDDLWLTKTIIDKSKTAFFHLSPLGEILYANEYACDILGYTNDELSGMHPWDFDTEFTLNQWTQVWNKLQVNGIVTFESQYQRKDGIIQNIDVTCHYIAHQGQEYSFTIVQNISSRKQAEQTFRQKEAYQRALIDNFPFNVWLKDTDCRFLAVNQALAETLGYSDKDSLIGKNDFDIATPDVAEHYRKDDIEVMTSRQQKIVEELFEGKENNTWVETFKAPAIDDSGVLLGTVGFSRDISKRKAIEAELQIAAIAFECQEGMIITDPNSIILKINQSFSRITGYTEKEAIGQKMYQLTSGLHDRDFYESLWQTIQSKGSWQGEISNRRKNGVIYPEWLTITAVKDNMGTVTHYVSTMTDITSRKAIEEQVQHLAHHDALTDLPNRTLLTDRMNQALAQARRQDTMLALLFLDLDKFKPVNDLLGHDVGDLLLQEVAKRLLNCVKRESDTISRIGGDEFVILLARIDTENDVKLIAQSILNAIEQPFNIQQHTLNISGSIGIATYPKQGIDIISLMKNADDAMYQAKKSGRNCFNVFSNKS